MRSRSVLLCTTALFLSGFGVANAQNAPPSGAPSPSSPGEPSQAENLTAQHPASAVGVEEIVVSAQKRSENVEKVPLSIVALSGAQLERSGTKSVLDLPKVVPSLQVFTHAQSAGVQFGVRGFGTPSNAAIDPDVATYLDGIYIPRPGAIVSSFLDTNNVEVLRGPQGTLFGRNATVGAIEIATNTPSLAGFTGSASVEMASYDTYKGQAIVNMPVTTTFAVRGAIEFNNTGGYVRNAYDNRTYGASDTTAGRLSAKWEITPNITWIGRFDAATTTGDGFNVTQLVLNSAPAAQLNAFENRVAQFGGTSSYNGLSYDTNYRLDAPQLRDHQVGVSSDLSWDVGGSGYKLRLVDSYRDWNNQQLDGDLAGTTLDLVKREASFRSDSQSHELQFLSPRDQLLGGRLSFVAGFYFFQEHYGIDTQYDLGSQWCPVITNTCAGPLNRADFDRFSQVETSYAGYAQADFKILSNLVLTLGGRLTDDDKTGQFSSVAVNPAAVSLGANEQENNLHVSKTAPTGRANLSWTILPSVLAYASYSTGYKSGGFNSAAAFPALTTATRTFAEETSDNYEVGLKSVLFDHRLLLNLDAYQMDIDNFQSRAYNGVTFIIQNAGNIRARGIEADGQFQATSHIKFSFGGDYLSSTYSSFPDAPGLPGCSTKVVNSCVGYENMVGGNPTTQNLTGRPVNYAPKWQGDFAAEYDTSPFAGGYILQVRPDISYLDRFYSTNDDNPNAIVKSHTLVDLRVTLASPSGRWTLTAYGTNLADKLYYTDKYAQTLGGALGGANTTTGATLLRGYLGQPRTFGVKLAAQF